MGVRRDQPTDSVPGELHTKDGRKFRVKLPPELQRGETHETTEAKPKPPQPDDPRPAGPLRDIPGYRP
jgi:hypothetical protein